MRSWERVWTAAVVVVAGGLVMACDKEAKETGGTDAARPATSASATTTLPIQQPPEMPPLPRPPAITVDDRGCTIDGTAFTGAPAEWQERAEKLLGENPRVAGQAVVVNAMRDTKVPRVSAIVAAVRAAKAKSVVVRTAMRDQSSGEVELLLHPGQLPECSAVAMIEHDGAVALWSKGGGGAQRFARGMAGPDLSASTEALRKRASSCDSPAWFVGAADAVTWGLVFDLATRARGGEGGADLRPKETVLLTHPPVAGRGVKED